MTKQRELLKKIHQEAKKQGLTFELHEHGGNHDKYLLGGMLVTVPRHTEIGNRMAEKIYKDCEPKLGNRWWK